MSTQNAKSMTTWMGFRYMGHSHGQPFRQQCYPHSTALIWLNSTPIHLAPQCGISPYSIAVKQAGEIIF
jgi:hypothetical protein